jgi:anthranilate phosphoribosyltransferase
MQPQIDVVTANAGMAIHCIKPAQSIEDCLAEAKESIVSGKALATLHKLIN